MSCMRERGGRMTEQESIEIFEKLKSISHAIGLNIPELGNACDLAIQALKNEQRRQELLDYYHQRACLEIQGSQVNTIYHEICVALDKCEVK